ncbi:MAG TPA: hypothetical protein VJK03_03920 [Candidatus Nanoarchaeia archaeon]|nr:hypothetical protein [Candidatus Nanoarchaeia archaeon]
MSKIPYQKNDALPLPKAGVCRGARFLDAQGTTVALKGAVFCQVP